MLCSSSLMYPTTSSAMLYPPSFQALLAQLSSRQASHDQDQDLGKDSEEEEEADINGGVTDPDAAEKDDPQPTDLRKKPLMFQNIKEDISKVDQSEKQDKFDCDTKPVYETKFTNDITDAQPLRRSPEITQSIPLSDESRCAASKSASPPSYPIESNKRVKLLSEEFLRNQKSSEVTPLDVQAVEAFRALESCRTLDLRTLEEYRVLLERRTLQARSREAEEDLEQEYQGQVRSYPQNALFGLYPFPPSSSPDQTPPSSPSDINNRMRECTPEVIIQKSQ